MPVNEIQAPIYIKGRLATPVYPSGHQFRLYFRTGCSWMPGLIGDVDNWRLMVDGLDQGSVSALMTNLWNRFGSNLPANSVLTSIELWHSIPNADNVLDHFNTLPIVMNYGVGAGVAAGYIMRVFGGPLRNLFRFSVFDGGDANPQKFPPISPPLADNASPEWFFLKGGFGFATNDGIALTREVSINSGYNRKLARSYGRVAAP